MKCSVVHHTMRCGCLSNGQRGCAMFEKQWPALKLRWALLWLHWVFQTRSNTTRRMLVMEFPPCTLPIILEVTRYQMGEEVGVMRVCAVVQGLPPHRWGCCYFKPRPLTLVDVHDLISTELQLSWRECCQLRDVNTEPNRCERWIWNGINFEWSYWRARSYLHWAVHSRHTHRWSLMTFWHVKKRVHFTWRPLPENLWQPATRIERVAWRRAAVRFLELFPGG